MFENVDKRTDGWRLESFVYYKLTLEPSALVRLNHYLIRPCVIYDLHFVEPGAYDGQLLVILPTLKYF